MAQHPEPPDKPEPPPSSTPTGPTEPDPAEPDEYTRRFPPLPPQSRSNLVARAYLDYGVLTHHFVRNTILALADPRVEMAVFDVAWRRDELEDVHSYIAARSSEFADAVRSLITTHWPDSEVTVPSGLEGYFSNDRAGRTLAGAVACDAAYLVSTGPSTSFDREVCDYYGIAVVSPDQLLLDVLRAHRSLAVNLLIRHVAGYRHLTFSGFLDRIAREGVGGTANFLAELHDLNDLNREVELLRADTEHGS